MGKPGGGLPAHKGPAFRHLIESALRKVADERAQSVPKRREDWLEALCEALLSNADASYQRVIASMIANGISEETICETYLPDVAAILGERWVQDTASFVDVSVGASRLQDFIRSREASREAVRDRLIPLGQSVLLIIPMWEQHGLGAFVAANQFRQHGLWAHVSIGLQAPEIVDQVDSRRFAMVGITLGSDRSVEKTRELIKYMRANCKRVPPVVIGGPGASEGERVLQRTGADMAAGSAREAVQRLGLVSVEDIHVTEPRE